MIEINELANTISEIKRNNNSLDILLNIENLFDKMHLYAYEHWLKGEVIRGPIINKYWVEVYIMYHKKFKPNSDGAKRLIKHGCKVYIKEDELETSVKIKKPEDINPELDTQGRRKPNKEIIPVYIIKIVFPRMLLDNYNLKRYQSFLDDANLDEITNAFDKGYDLDGLTRENESDKEEETENDEEEQA